MAELVTAVVLLSAGVDGPQSETAFQALGFETQSVIGGSLLITGSVALFEDKFGGSISNDALGQQIETADGGTRAYAKENFPEQIKGLADAIEFEAPQEFGPSDY